MSWGLLNRLSPAGRWVILVAIILLTASGVVWGVLRWSSFPELEAYLQRPRSVELLDRHGVPLRMMHPDDGTRRSFVALDALPEWVPAAFIAAEDQRYYMHIGVDPVSILRAAAQNARSTTTVSGASTITMQLSRLVAPHRGGLAGKLTEAWNALRLEARLSKADILELYLNGLPFGAAAEGIDAAARHYFGRPATELAPEEAAILAVVPRRPSALHPHRNPERVIRTVLPSARRAGIPADPRLLRATIEAGRERAATPAPFHAPHFAEQAARRLTPAQWQAGVSVRTSLDLELQEALEAAIYSQLQSAESSRIHNAAGLVLDHRRGEILAYVGSMDYFDAEHGGMIDAVHIRRQPGSSLKPFLYGLALEMGFTAATILPDIPQAFGGAEAYIPQNFSRRFAGPVRLRTALSSSLNIPAVYTVVRLGVANFADHLEQLGFESVRDQRDRVGAGIALGNVEVSLFELARGFSVFARDGVLPEYRFFPEDHADLRSRPVYSRASAQIIRDILGDQAHRVLGFGPDSILNTDFPMIAKTGTANQFSNIWAVASSPDYTIGVWMGNIHGETVIGRPGSSLPARAAVDVLAKIHDPDSNFPPLDAVHEVRISPVSGMGYNPSEGGSVAELFPDGVYPPDDTWHTYPGGPIRYPAEFQDWARDLGMRATATAHQTAGTSAVRIMSPNKGARFYRDPYIRERNQSIGVTAVTDGDEVIQLYWNGALAAEGQSPLRWQLPVVRGVHTLTAAVGAVSDQIQVTVGEP